MSNTQNVVYEVLPRGLYLESSGHEGSQGKLLEIQGFILVFIYGIELIFLIETFDYHYRAL